MADCRECSSPTLSPIYGGHAGFVPYCSDECSDAAAVRAALGEQRCEACYAVVPLRGGFASGPADDPKVPGVCCSPDCYALVELREQIAPSIYP